MALGGYIFLFDNNHSGGVRIRPQVEYPIRIFGWETHTFMNSGQFYAWLSRICSTITLSIWAITAAPAECLTIFHFGMSGEATIREGQDREEFQSTQFYDCGGERPEQPQGRLTDGWTDWARPAFSHPLPRDDPRHTRDLSDVPGVNVTQMDGSWLCAIDSCFTLAYWCT